VKPVRILIFVSTPLLWLLKYVLTGLTLLGLGARATPITDSGDGCGAPSDPSSAAVRAGRELAASTAALSHHERLWEAELAADDAGAV